MNAEPNSYPIVANALIETLITLLVQVIYAFSDTKIFKLMAIESKQGFFLIEIYKLSNSVSTSVVCAFLALLRFIGGIATCAEAFLDVPNALENGFSLVIHFGWLITSTFAVGGALDVFIAAFMTCHLRKLMSTWNPERYGSSI